MGRILALIIWLTALVIGAWFAFTKWWFPPVASEHGAVLDRQFNVTLVITGVVFLLAQLALGYAVWRFRARGATQAVHTHGNARVEAVLALSTAVIFIALAALGQRVWWGMHINQAPRDAVQIEVVGQQFLWNFRYPGADGKFGRSKPELYNDADNAPTARPGPLGLDPNDAAGKDDLVSVGLFAVPVNREINLTLRAKDVTHSLFIPAMRLKQDAVPGLRINVHFKPVQTGRYEIACAELCGQLHHNMRAFLEVKTPDEYERWLQEKAAQ